MKSLIYDYGPIYSVRDIVSRITVVADTIREMPGGFVSVRRSIFSKCKACGLLVAAI